MRVSEEESRKNDDVVSNVDLVDTKHPDPAELYRSSLDI